MTTWIEPTVDLKLEIAFSTDPLATTPTWTDVTPYLRRKESIQISRGTTSEDSAVGPGFATFTLDNLGRRFDPDYSAGAYYPNVKPMRRVRLTVTKSSAAVVFTGFVMSWTNDWTIADGVSIVRCVDSMWWLANKPLAGSAYEAEVVADAPMAYWRTFGIDQVDRIGSLGATPQPSENPIFDYVAEEVMTASMGFPVGDDTGFWDGGLGISPAFTAQPKAIEYWVKPRSTDSVWFTVTAGLNSHEYLIIDYQGGVGFFFQHLNTIINTDITTAYPYELRSGRRYHIATWVDNTNVYLMINGTTVMTTALNTATSWPAGSGESWVGFGASSSTSVTDAGFGHVAVYDVAPSESRFQAHYIAGLLAYGGTAYKERGGTRIERVLDEIGWPASLRAIDTGTFRHLAYLPADRQAADYIADVVGVERGLFFCSRTGGLTFLDLVSMTDNSSGVVFSDDGGVGAIRYSALKMAPASVDTVRNVVTVSYSTTGGVTSRDATSEEENGTSRLFIDGPTLELGRDAGAIASFELAQRKDPSTRVESITVLWRQGVAADTTTAIDTCSSIEIGDVVTVEITPLGVGSQVVKTCQVVGFEHLIELEQATTTLYMRPAYTQTGWFTVGTSALGGTDVLLP